MEFSRFVARSSVPHTFSLFLQFNHLYWHLLTGTADFHLNGKLLSNIANMPVHISQ